MLNGKRELFYWLDIKFLMVYYFVMDELSRKEFDRITQLPADSLTIPEIDFLYARRSYCTKSDRAEYGDLLKKKDAEVKAAAEKVEE